MATITCINCLKGFEFTDEEKKWFKKMGYLEPKRCRDCRVKKRALYAMREENK